MDIFADYSSWTMPAKAYFCIALFATIVLVIQLLLSLIGFDHHDVDVEVDHDLSGIEGITFFSFRSLVAFFSFFGWVGFICVKNGVWVIVSLFVASGAGVIAFLGVALCMHFFYKMAESGNVTIDKAIGEIATIYLTIPEGKNESGAINVNLAGALREYKAVSENGAELKTGVRVQVVGTLDSTTLIVKELEKPSDWTEKGLT